MTDVRPSVSPTGEQWRLSRGRQQLVVTEVGATLRSYRVEGRDVVDGFGPDQWSHGGRGQVLAPWPNRLGGGRYTFGGVTAQAALNEPDRGNAIHGLVRWLPWRLRTRTASSVVAQCLFHPAPGYPFMVDLSLEYRLDDHGLSVTTTATNVGTLTLPLGLGFHPYLTAGADRIDTCTLTVPAALELALDAQGLPTGERRRVVHTADDWTTSRVIGASQLDSAFTGLHRDDDGRARCLLEDPSSGHGVELWMDERFSYVMCFTGDTLEDPSRRRRSMALEPMTCPPDALRSGADLIVLEPGQHWEGAWGLRPRE